jgi:hypothetical protein
MLNNIQEQPYHNRILQRRLEDLQACFDSLQLRFEELKSQLDPPKKGNFVHRRQKFVWPQSEISGERKGKAEQGDTFLCLVKSKKGWFKVEGCCREAAKLEPNTFGSTPAARSNVNSGDNALQNVGPFHSAVAVQSCARLS